MPLEKARGSWMSRLHLPLHFPMQELFHADLSCVTRLANEHLLPIQKNWKIQIMAKLLVKVTFNINIVQSSFFGEKENAVILVRQHLLKFEIARFNFCLQRFWVLNGCAGEDAFLYDLNNYQLTFGLENPVEHF